MYNKQLIIEKIDLSNLNELQIVARETFSETFSNENTEEDMNDYLSITLGNEQLTKELNDPYSAFYLAKLEDQVVGYLKLNFENDHVEDSKKSGLEVERVYVLKEYHGKNVGQIILNKAFEISRSKNAPFIYLGVWEHNQRAIRFYEKNGFIAYSTKEFILGKDIQTDILMKLVL